MVSRKCKYALAAIFELAFRNIKNPVKIHDIAAAQAIPQRFLEIILAELKHAGFLESRRGIEGGYILAKPADTITVGDVIFFLEGDFSKVKREYKDTSNLIGNYAFKRLWNEVTMAISDVYKKTTFADLVQQELKNREKQIPNYVI
ncbi:MAG: Rrf2 family transcriptional regulator [Sedimentisphaerales bacterium]|nr:Rrf2 family transcriptional regulator [Sedimentisphaerales bacterium]